MKAQIKQILNQYLKKEYPKVEEISFTVEQCDSKFGDYSTNIAMVLGKVIGESPKGIAEKIIKEIGTSEIIEKADVAGPGFINFKIALPYLNQKISEIIKEDANYGKSDIAQDFKVCLEFISANPTGPLTLGNGRGGYTGDVLGRVFEFLGARVSREYYLNDTGKQVLALGHSVLKDGESVYKGEYLENIASKVKSKDPQAVGEEAAAIIREEYIEKTIARMGIKFNEWFSERNFTESGDVEKILKTFEKLNLSYEKEGALFLKTSAFGDDKDRPLITSEGEYTYFTSDIAYHLDKIRRGYDLLIDLWGADHHGYVGRMESAIKIFQKEENWSGKLVILISQLVRLISEGKEVKMSKRAGTYVTLDELIDEIGSDVTRYFFLEKALNTHMDFNLDLAKIKSEKNPVFYIQYAYARINSIQAKLKVKSKKEKEETENLPVLDQPVEIKLIKELLELPNVVTEVAENYQVQQLPYYARQLARTFHEFYEKCPVLYAPEDLKNARLQLLLATKIVLKNTLDLMGVSTPEKM